MFVSGNLTLRSKTFWLLSVVFLILKKNFENGEISVKTVYFHQKKTLLTLPIFFQTITLNK